MDDKALSGWTSGSSETAQQPVPAGQTAAAQAHERNIRDIPAAAPRPAGSIYMGGFRAPAIETVRLAVIGLGEERGMPQMQLIPAIPHCEVVAVCDMQADATKEAADFIGKKTGKRPAEYNNGSTAYLEMLKEVGPDAVIISTPWETHARIAIDCMETGAHALVEVPLAITIEELWRVVDTSERTRKHCMMMENVNYGRDELMFLNMVRQGLIGELLHGEAAYIHDLRKQMKSAESGCGSWRTYHHTGRNGNIYPTHGLGPVAQYMNIARGEDMFDRIVSFGSPALGRAAYAKKHLPADHKWNQTVFQCADMNTSLIKTKAGRTILVQLDETSPRPYDRKNLIQGTEGTLAGFPTRVVGENIGWSLVEDGREEYLEGQSRGHHRWYQGEEAEADLHKRYEHPLYKRLGAAAEKDGGHGGMDYIMLYRIIECLHKGWPLDQNVYEGALWSAVGPLSEKSVHEGGMPQEFPDFTRGDWKHTAPLPIVE